MTNFGTYDGFGRRVKKGSRYYIYAGDKLLGEISGGAVDKVYTWGADGLVSQRLVGTNVSYWYHFGPQGETRHLTNVGGNVVGTYTYDAYGKQITTTGGINNNFRYGGKYGYYYDEQVYGMYLAGARWYSPDLYRWMSRDPIEYAGGDNMFAYVAGNPVMYHDRSGFVPVKNNSGKDIYYKPERTGGKIEVCRTGETCDMDGIYPQNPESLPIKIRDFPLCYNCSVGKNDTIRGCSPLGKQLLDPDFFKIHNDWPDPYTGRNNYPKILPRKNYNKQSNIVPSDPLIRSKVGVMPK